MAAGLLVGCATHCLPQRSTGCRGALEVYRLMPGHLLDRSTRQPSGDITRLQGKWEPDGQHLQQEAPTCLRLRA